MIIQIITVAALLNWVFESKVWDLQIRIHYPNSKIEQSIESTFELGSWDRQSKQFQAGSRTRHTSSRHEQEEQGESHLSIQFDLSEFF